MITLNTTIQEVLDRHPELLEVLASASPAFHKLRFPLLRQVMARRVNVAQAAQIGGLQPQQLLVRLNAALGLLPSPASEVPGLSTSTLGTPRPDWTSLEGFPTLDVRPLLQQGQDPFRSIMQVARPLQVGTGFRLLAPFEPVPLYQALGKQGFVGWCEQQGVSYLTHFHRESLPGEFAAPAGQAAALTPQFDAEVSIPETLEPPEPMLRVLTALDALKPGGTLLVHHVRRPVYLLEKLQDLHFQVQLQDQGPGKVELWIHKPVTGS